MNKKIALSILFCVSLVVRLCYLFFAGGVVFGDAVNYSFVSQGLLSVGEIDTFWLNGFCFFQSLFHLLPIEHTAATLLSSFIPGVFLFLPLYCIGEKLYSRSVGFVAALFFILHPRLIEYSCNGYPETFYILLLAFFIWAFLEKRYITAGFFLGLVISCRNEYLLFFALVCCMQKIQTSWYIAKGVCTSLVIYVLLSYALTGSPGVLQKMTVLGKSYSEQLDMRASAKEIYGEGSEPSKESFIERIGHNIGYSLKKMPLIILSPFLLFGLCAFPFILSQPLFLLLTLFVFLFYPLIQVEPRYFFAALLPLHLYAAVGWARIKTKRWPLVLLALLLLVLTGYRARQVERQYRVHKETAAYLKEHLKEKEVVMGCGYGYCSTTLFLLNKGNLRRPFVTSKEELLSRLEGVDWLILYEEYIKRADYELLEVFNTGIVGWNRSFETKDPSGNRVQVYSKLL